MNQWDQLTQKAKAAADVAGKKTGELVELSKLKLAVGQIHMEIKEKQQQLGEAVYHMHTEGYENPEYIEGAVAELNRLSERLTKTQEKICALKKMVKCLCCGAPNPIDSSYCGQCGCKLSQDVEED